MLPRARMLPVLTASEQQTYIQKVTALSPIAYWPFNEASGTTADNAEGTAARDGTYTAVTLGQTGIGDGNTCPLFDGATSYVNLLTASLRAAVNYVEGTFSGWFKLNSTWTDGARGFIFYLYSAGGSYIIIEKRAENNQFRFRQNNAAGTDRLYDINPFTSTAWNHVAMTWTATGNAVICYMNGVQVDGGLAGPGAQQGATIDGIFIGSASAVPGNPWKGWLAHPALWTSALTPTQIASLAAV